jgi:hypothetical protein
MGVGGFLSCKRQMRMEVSKNEEKRFFEKEAKSPRDPTVYQGPCS